MAVRAAGLPKITSVVSRSSSPASRLGALIDHGEDLTSYSGSSAKASAPWYSPAARLRARILGLRCLAVLAGFSELNPQLARDVRQTALAGPPMLHDGYRQDAGAALGS